MINEIIRKISEMEKMAYADYTDAATRCGEDGKHTQELKYRHLGILEVKREILRNV